MSEDSLQQQIYVWFNNNYCLKTKKPQYCIFSVPNGKTRNIIEAKKLKATGLKAGVSDLIVLIPNKCIFIELKTETGKQSDKQKEFEQIVTNLGFEYYIIKSLEQFKKLIYEKT
jgi:hypothetical protein